MGAIRDILTPKRRSLNHIKLQDHIVLADISGKHCTVKVTVKNERI